MVETNKSLKYLGLCFISNIIMHGIMDLVPHNYPVTTITDVTISFVFFFLSIIFVKREFVPPVFFCFLGGILPDLIDKGFFRILKMNNLKLFPWHWTDVINFFYKRYSAHTWMFMTFNILAIVASVCLLLMNRKFIFQRMLKFIKKGHGKHF
jgi:hypothetical protein